MEILSFSTAYTTCLLLSLSCPLITGMTIDHDLMPSESISAKINSERVRSGSKPHYRLHAERAGSNATEYMARVREAVPAVTSQTITIIQDGKSKYVNQDDVATILVSDEADVLALIAVEKKGGNVNGIVQKNGEKIKFTQRGGGGKVSFERSDLMHVSFVSHFSPHHLHIHLQPGYFRSSQNL
jgi:hypothetical protein